MQHPQNLPSVYDIFFPKEVDFSHIRLDAFFTYIVRPLGSKEVKNKFSLLLDEFLPDVIHLNNIHSQLSPIIAEIAHKKGIKIIWTLHDYKMLCPCYDCMREGKPCNLCYTNKLPVIRYSCMKNNSMASVLAYLEAIKWNREKLEKYSSTFICPSEFLRNEMISGGFNPQKLVVLNNFVDVDKIIYPVCQNKENYYCYVGRLSPEKGVETLLKAATELPFTLRIVGSGILENELKKKYKAKNIIFEGYKSWSDIETIMGKAMFTVMPSECLENNSIATLESLTLGTPVLGACIGGIPEIIDENINGLLFESGNKDDLKRQIQILFEKSSLFNNKKIAQVARAKYSAKNHFHSLLEIYKCAYL
jgi:glycosyltransferase involved in cell wall biosynthesis